MKTKLTVSISQDILNRAKKVAEDRGIPISNLIENFLNFFVNPWVYCFRCGKKFYVGKSEVCPKCGYLLCPYCGACRCTLGDEEAPLVFYMRRVYEDLLKGRIK